MSRRGLIIALLISVAVNLFVVGGLGGMALMAFRMHGGPPPRGPGPPPFARANELSADLTPEHRAQWMATLRQAAESAGPRMRQARTLRRQAWQGLEADPVDVQAVLAGLAQARALEGQSRGDIDQRLVAFAAGLPPAERHAMAEKLARARIGGRLVFSSRRAGPPVGHQAPPPPDR
jgi:uncharacterized membrane protein